VREKEEFEISLSKAGKKKSASSAGNMGDLGQNRKSRLGNALPFIGTDLFGAGRHGPKKERNSVGQGHRNYVYIRKKNRRAAKGGSCSDKLGGSCCVGGGSSNTAQKGNMSGRGKYFKRE